MTTISQFSYSPYFLSLSLSLSYMCFNFENLLTINKCINFLRSSAQGERVYRGQRVDQEAAVTI